MFYSNDRRHSNNAKALAITAAGLFFFAPASFGQSAPGIPAQTPRQAAQVIVIAAESPANAAAASTVWDMPKTIAAALASSTDFANALRAVQIDSKRADEEAAAARPNASVSGSATNFDSATRVTFGPSTFKVMGDNTQTLAVNLSDEVDLTGKVHAKVDQVKLQSQADIYAAQQIRNARILRAQTIYYNLLRARHQVSVAQASLTNAETQLATAKSLNAGGVGQKIDMLRATTQVAEAQQSLTQAVNIAAVAEASFNDLVRLPLNMPVAVQDVPGAAVGVTVTNATSVGAPTPDMTLFAPPIDEVGKIDLDQSMRTAETTRPEILQARTRLAADRLGIRLAHAGLEPTLKVSAGGFYYPTTSFQSPRRQVGEVTADIVLPLYDGGATRDRISEARLQTQDAEASLSSAHTDVALDVQQAYLNVLTAAHQIEAANSALQQAIAARQLAQIRYEGQVGLYLEVTDAESALVYAQSNQVNAVYDYQIAHAQFLNALGTPFTGR